MKKVLILASLLVLLQATFCHCLQAQLTTSPDGGNKKASVSERIGITDVTIHYSRPGVKKREGKIWGVLIPVGYNSLGYGNSTAAPWRAGANENTTIEFSTDVTVEGQPLRAGKYGFFIAYDPAESTIIFSKNSSSWGSFFYDPAEDALRVKVKPLAADKSVEWLKYEFSDQTPNSAVVALQWEKLVIPIKIAVDLQTTQLASFRKELQSEIGFYWQNWAQAADWCYQNNVNLDQALLWADTATSTTFGGEKSFQAWTVKAEVLNKLGRNQEGTEIMKKALPYGNIYDLNQYANQLIGQKKLQEALSVFKQNYDQHPSEFIATMGMAKGYSALGEFKKALEYAQKAQPQATSQEDKDRVAKSIESLQQGKDIN
jgi:hypothetical protein